MNIVLQVATPKYEDLPKKTALKKVFRHAWCYLQEKNLLPKEANTDPELLLRIVTAEEMRTLNHQYRHKDYPTNVLSFSSELPKGLDCGFLGDIIICHEVLKNEAKTQQKALRDHYAHLLIHGVLHLLGYDHIDEVEAEQMEAIEIDILALLNIANPYEENL